MLSTPKPMDWNQPIVELLAFTTVEEHILDIPYPWAPERGQKCLSICLLLCPPKLLSQIKPNLLSDLLTQVGCAIAERGQKCPSADLRFACYAISF